MALKGSATIELTNADGSKDIIRHDNMITNAVADLCLSQRGEMSTILKMVNHNDSYAQSMFGGILLFSDILNDDTTDYIIPSVNVVGYASQNAYAGLDICRGSFNESESGVQEDGSYRFVWDFATSQANGTISSLALCPNFMGLIGITSSVVSSEMKEFNLVKYPTEPFNTYGYMLSNDGETNGISNWCYHIIAIDGDIAYAVDYYNICYEDNYKERALMHNGGILKLYKFKLGTSKISFADKVGRARYIGCVDVKLPTLFTSVLVQYGLGYVSFYYDCNAHKIIVFPCNTNQDIDVNSTLPYLDIDIRNNMAITNYTFTNTAPDKVHLYTGQFRPCVHDYDAHLGLYITDKYIVCMAMNSKLYIIDRNNNTNIKVVKHTNGEEFVMPGGGCIGPVYTLGNILALAIDAINTSYSNVYLLDLKNGIIKSTNISRLSNVKANVNFGNKAIQVKTGPYLTYFITVNPFILTTKNNLDSPVTKTASQTMKITYTLKESEV